MVFFFSGCFVAVVVGVVVVRCFGGAKGAGWHMFLGWEGRAWEGWSFMLACLVACLLGQKRWGFGRPGGG